MKERRSTDDTTDRSRVGAAGELSLSLDTHVLYVLVVHAVPRYQSTLPPFIPYLLEVHVYAHSLHVVHFFLQKGVGGRPELYIPTHHTGQQRWVGSGPATGKWGHACPAHAATAGSGILQCSGRQARKPHPHHTAATYQPQHMYIYQHIYVCLLFQIVERRRRPLQLHSHQLYSI